MLSAALSCTGIARAVACLGNTLVGAGFRAEAGLLLLPGIGFGAASRKFVEVMGITWAGSQITKVTLRSHNGAIWSHETRTHVSAAQAVSHTSLHIADVPNCTGIACAAGAAAQAKGANSVLLLQTPPGP